MANDSSGFSLKQRVRAGASRAKTAAADGKKRGKKGIVKVITSDKVIQSFLTGSVVGIVTSFFEGTSVLVVEYINTTTFLFIPSKWLLAFFLVFVFYASYWADQNTETFREWIEETTGEEAADDGPDDAQQTSSSG